ncbi:MAG: filamentous hemagglutinin N-terminal domain-containing protein [Verrucomicrobia bacterium]|nr:filamentous hemagglutinin N-terminal domain-containing protein [Verrucomicrobiota bacterium]
MNKYELSHIRYWFLFVGLCLTAGQCLQAQIALDGTIGPSGPLTGPNYQIGAELGKQVGGNLFHSFKDFSLNSGEAATFSGPATVQNIISRVTGGNASSIDGAIRSTIPDSNFYLLNPAGVMFGPNASVDVRNAIFSAFRLGLSRRPSPARSVSFTITLNGLPSRAAFCSRR